MKANSLGECEAVVEARRQDHQIAGLGLDANPLVRATLAHVEVLATFEREADFVVVVNVLREERLPLFTENRISGHVRVHAKHIHSLMYFV